MVISQIKEELETSQKPIAKSLHHNKNFRVIALGFKKDMILTAHTAKWPSKLTILEGSVIYNEGDKSIEIKQYEEYEIPVGILHSVVANEDSLCLLTQSDQ